MISPSNSREAAVARLTLFYGLREGGENLLRMRADYQYHFFFFRTNDDILPFDGSCRYLLALDLQQSFVSGAGISVEPFCTTDGEVPPGKVRKFFCCGFFSAGSVTFQVIIANALLILCAGWIIFVVIGEIRFYVGL